MSTRAVLAAGIGCLLLPTFPPNSTANGLTAQKVEEIQMGQAGGVLESRFAIAYLGGEAREYVYDSSWDGEKGSELIWTLDNIFMVGLGLSFQPLYQLRINFDAWINANNGTGEMDNYDWFERNKDWTDWSHSEQVDLDKGLVFDINAEYTVFDQNLLSISAIIGYRYDKWKWRDYGDGPYIYSVDGYRDTTGYFPANTLGISYEQSFGTAYIAVAIKGKRERFEWETGLIASPFVSAKAVDHHHLRNAVFHDKFDDGDMVAVNLRASYRFNERYRVELGYAFQKYFTMRGNTTAYYFDDAEVATYPGGAGTELEYHTVSGTFHFSF